MIWRQSGKIEWIESELLNEYGIVHGWFSRSGGVSTRPFDSLNIKHGFADSTDNVDINRQRALKALAVEDRQLVFIRHEHGSQVLSATAKMSGKDQLADAIIANDSQFMLGQGTADCNSIIVADNRHQVVALVHASWRSLLDGVIFKTMQKLSVQLKQPADLVAVLGPSVCGNCYQFGPEAKELFDASYTTFKGGKYYVDLKTWAHDELQAAGIKQIENLGICTMEDERFFSHRRDQDNRGQTGRFLTLAGL